MLNNHLNQIEDNLFFIAGCGRSGTTLFRIILNAHPEVFVPPETYFFNGIAKGFGVDNTSSEKKICKLLSKWWIRDMKVEKSAIVELLDNSSHSWREVFLAFIGALSADSGAIRFGEKTPGHFKFAQRLLDEYPHCKIILLLRDPRASFASFRSAKVGTGQVSDFIKKWSYATEVAQSLEGNPRVKRVYFEELITDTEGVMDSVCTFLNISFHDDMMNYHSRKDRDYSPEQTHHENTQRPIFTSGLVKWKSQLSTTQIGLIEHSLGEQMVAMGYELDGIKITFPRIRYMYSLMIDKLIKLFILKPKQFFIKRKVFIRLRQENSLTNLE